jgi:uncharacterized cupin superfamily protein
LIDPVSMSDSDFEHMKRLGGASLIIITNRDHERESGLFRDRTGAEVVVHEADADGISIKPDRKIQDDEEVVPGLRAIQLRHGKSPGEIALYWPKKRTMLVGDLVVGAPMGRLTLLDDSKLADPAKAALGLRKLLNSRSYTFDVMLVGDGHSIFENAKERLVECLQNRADIYINRINIDELEWKHHNPHKGYERYIAEVGDLIGARNLGYQLLRLPPGQSTYPMHFHYFAEEMFYVIEGECTLLTPRGDLTVRSGDFIAFPPGKSGAHKFRNDGEKPCVLLALGNNLSHEVGEYPDSDKIATIRGIYRRRDIVDYWEGE